MGRRYDVGIMSVLRRCAYRGVSAMPVAARIGLPQSFSKAASPPPGL